MAFHLAECCHPVPGDRIVGIRQAGKGVEVHAIDCLTLASGVDADWLDLSWGETTTGAAYFFDTVKFGERDQFQLNGATLPVSTPD